MSKILFNEDAEDKILAKVQAESLRFYKEVELPRFQLQKTRSTASTNDPSSSAVPLQDGNTPVVETAGSSKIKCSRTSSSQIAGPSKKTYFYEGPEAPGFHIDAGDYYVYPTNYPVRQYQSNIVKTALFKNTLVCLPTGLGKTFIAAVVMYNFYRWYPCGKIIFMAPTRPLVTQQIKACHNIMNIPVEDTTEMTGLQSAESRVSLWKEKRVFFLTPQVLNNDLNSNICPAHLIRCIVVDEAHRALKDYAYCQAIRFLNKAGVIYRTLGLSATPGSDVSAVQQVVQNLSIQSLELRGEESLDVAPYTHSKCVEPVVVDLSVNIKRVREDFLQVYDKYAKKLREIKALPGNISNISKFQVWNACKRFRENPPRNVPPAIVGGLVSDFTVCMSLAHALELLQIYGLRAFYSYLTDDVEKGKAAVTRIRNDPDLKKVLQRLKEVLYPPADANVPYTWGHPKLQKLFTALSEHFNQAKAAGEMTKAIVFCEYRVVVSEIVDILQRADFDIRPATFIGQSGGKGMKQSQQLKIMKDFRSGLINCIVATCVAEEGLDIGEVDLIILMESHKSPVRLVQRIGRTGRKRRGKCIVMLTQGKEEYKFHEAMATRKSYITTVMNSKHIQSSLCTKSPRMIPPDLEPKQQLIHINVQEVESPSRNNKKKQADIRNCFTGNNSPFLDESDLQEVLNELDWNDSLRSEQIPPSEEFWPSINGMHISPDILLEKRFSCLSSWNIWNTELCRTFEISHSPLSEAVCEILRTTYTGSKYDLKNSATTGDPKKALGPSGNGKKKKDIPKPKMGMDIRTCMASLAEKWKPVDPGLINCDVSIEHQDITTDISVVESDDEDLGLGVSLKACKNWLNDPDQKCHFEEDLSFYERVNSYLLPHTQIVSWLVVPELPDLSSLSKMITSSFLQKLDWKLEHGLLDVSHSPIKVNNSPLTCKLSTPHHQFSPSPIKHDEAHIKLPTPNGIKENHVYRVTNNDLTAVTDDSNDIVDIDDLFDEQPFPVSGMSLMEKEYQKRCEGSKNQRNELLQSAPMHPETPTFLKGSVKNSPEKINQNISKSDTIKSKNKSCADLFWDETPEGLSQLELSKKSLQTSTSGKGIVCSTPNVSAVTKYKGPKKSIVKCLVKSSCTESNFEDDFWNIDDLFDGLEAEKVVIDQPLNSDGGPVKENLVKSPIDCNGTTLLGVTQLCNLIEEEKLDTFKPHHNQPPSNVMDEKPRENLSTVDPIPLLLDEDTDIFKQIPTELSCPPVVSNEKIDSPIKAEQHEENLDESFALMFSKKINVKKFKKQKAIYTTIPSNSLEIVSKETNPSNHFNPNQKPLVDPTKEVILNRCEPSPASPTVQVQKGEPVSPINAFKSKEIQPTRSQTSAPSFGVPFISPIKKLVVNNNATFSSPESPLIPLVKRKKTMHQKDKSLLLNSSNSPKSPIPVPHQSKPPKKKKSVKDAKDFIENEAEESGNISSDDLDNSDLDGLEESFIDDAHSSTDMHSKYLESVKSPVRGVFKIPKSTNLMNVYSQYVEPDADYINDSFCVDSEGESDRVEDSFLDLVEQKLNSKHSNENCNQGKSKKSSEKRGGSTVNLVSEKKGSRKRKRIVIMPDSDSDVSPVKNETPITDVKSDCATSCSSSHSKKAKLEDVKLKSDKNMDFVLCYSQQDFATSQDLRFDEDLKKAIQLSREALQLEKSKPVGEKEPCNPSYRNNRQMGLPEELTGTSRSLKAVENLNKKFNKRLKEMRQQLLDDSD